jgi:hypothetical protein
MIPTDPPSSTRAANSGTSNHWAFPLAPTSPIVELPRYPKLENPNFASAAPQSCLLAGALRAATSRGFRSFTGRPLGITHRDVSNGTYGLPLWLIRHGRAAKWTRPRIIRATLDVVRQSITQRQIVRHAAAARVARRTNGRCDSRIPNRAVISSQTIARTSQPSPRRVRRWANGKAFSHHANGRAARPLRSKPSPLLQSENSGSSVWRRRYQPLRHQTPHHRSGGQLCKWPCQMIWLRHTGPPYTSAWSFCWHACGPMSGLLCNGGRTSGPRRIGPRQALSLRLCSWPYTQPQGLRSNIEADAQCLIVRHAGAPVRLPPGWSLS